MFSRLENIVMGANGFLFETVQSIPFRTMTESLKEILVDCIFKFTPKGVSVVSMDNTKSIIVQLLLFKDNIERYQCDDDYYLGINLNTFFKVHSCKALRVARMAAHTTVAVML